MDQKKIANLYDAYYYVHGCGLPYDREQHWLDFFGTFADRIIATISAKKILDAGCAWGFLVESLRDRGVEAFGVDISEYAIDNVREDIKPFCVVGSVTEPFPEPHYDLVTCTEILEHMQPAEAEKAIANLCRHTDDIIFSSSPFDYKEVTHFNVREPEYWAEQFARQGFFRDIDFDASFITPWAVRFRRREESVARIVREYERKFWLLWKENVDLRSLAIETRQELSTIQDICQQEKSELLKEIDWIKEQKKKLAVDGY